MVRRGGQAGLSVGYHLARQGLRFVILDANERIGEPGGPAVGLAAAVHPAPLQRARTACHFPARAAFPTKDEVADYLETYAARFGLPVRTGVRVKRLSRERRPISSSRRRPAISRPATSWWRWGRYQLPKDARVRADLDPGIVQLHAG